MSIFKFRTRKINLGLMVVQIILGLLVFAIALKLAELQVFDPNHLKAKAKKMRSSKSLVYRGEIVDRNGVRLASDAILYDIYAHPRYYNISPEKMAEKMAPYLEISEYDLYKKLNKIRYSTITVAKDIERDTINKIKALKIRGLDLVKKTDRVYPQGNLASHILGYVNFDANISAGVERIAESDLESLPSISRLETNGLGEVIYDMNTDPEIAAKPLKGRKLVLTIDSIIQHLAEKELAKMIKKTEADRGAVIVMNPRNGELLGFAVLPNYDPNEYNKADPSVVKNWALSDVYPPGSTFKVLTVASALDLGRITENEKVVDTGKIKIQGWDILNYDYYDNKYPGLIDLKYLFEHSSNIGSVKIALKMLPEEFHDKLSQFGIGKKTGIDLPGESAGILPKVKTWKKIRQATIGFGYSVASTPIQMAAAVATIANEGVWVTPHVIKKSKKIKKFKVMEPENARKISNLLELSIRESKSGAGKIANFTVAGKSGTSRRPNPNGPGYIEGLVYTSFVGYFPSKDPQVLIMVVIDNPKGRNSWGSTVAAPVFNEIATQVTRHLRMQPDAPGLHSRR